jgi:hypothetical protein
MERLVDHWEKLEKRKAVIANTREFVMKTCPDLPADEQDKVVQKVYMKIKKALNLP